MDNSTTGRAERQSFGVGARIEVLVRERGETRSIFVVAGSGGSFGGSSMQQEIGLGAADSIESVRIDWPGSGTHQQLTGLDMNRIYRVIETESEPVLVDLPVIKFEKTSLEVRHRHIRADYRGDDPNFRELLMDTY